MGVDVNEAWADDHAGGVNDSGSVGVADGASEDADFFVRDAYGAVVARVSCSVYYQAFWISRSSMGRLVRIRM